MITPVNYFSNYNINSKMISQQENKVSLVRQSSLSLIKPKIPLLSKMLILLILLLFVSPANATDITDNTCTFKVDGKLFSLAYLNKKAKSAESYYNITNNETSVICFNFCQPFLPQVCQNQGLPSSYSYLVSKKNDTYTCTPYSSNSKTSNFQPSSIQNDGDNRLNLTMQTQFDNITTQKSTIFLLDCAKEIQNFADIEIDQITGDKIIIKGESAYACPIFQMSSLWAALSDNKFIFGVLLFFIGFIMLFYGVLMIHLMIFITTYFLSFAALLAIFSAFLSPYSSRALIYFSLLFILFASTLIAYGLAKIVDFSIFFIGAFLGFILAAIVNTIFIKLFAVYSIWSLIFFQVIFTIPLGLLTFKYNKQIIVLSTSLAGAYMVVRPFSWIFGGFPNQFTLYESVHNGKIAILPWTFFIYLIVILGIFALGTLYQLMKIARKNNSTQHVSYLPNTLEDNLDIIHQHVQRLINNYSKKEQDQNQNYTKVEEGINKRNDKQTLGMELAAVKEFQEQRK